MIIQSIYTHIFTKNSKYYLYNSKNNLFAEIPEDMYIALFNCEYQSLSPEVLDYLKEKEVLVEEENKYLHYEESKIKFNTNSYCQSDMTLVIVPTTCCNFDCAYCFEGKKQNKTITPDIEDKIIEFIKKNEDTKRIHLTWYGGEPLLAFKNIKSLYSKISSIENIKIPSHSIVTNGYLITQEVIDFINESKVDSLQITLDGNESTHNKSRYLKEFHTPTFEVILQNIEKLITSAPDCKISVRVNISNDNSDDFFEVYEMLNKKFPGKYLNIYPGILRLLTDDGCAMCHNSVSQDERFQLYKKWYNKGANVKFLPHLKGGKGCMINQANSYIIGPEGELYKCWHDVNNSQKVIGNIMDDKLINVRLFCEYMIESSPYNSEECKNCLQFPICSGGCGYFRLKNLNENGRFKLCCTYKDLTKLEDALILSLEKHEILYKTPLQV